MKQNLRDRALELVDKLLEMLLVSAFALGFFLIPFVLSGLALSGVSLCTSRLAFDSDGFWFGVAAVGFVLLYFQIVVLRNTTRKNTEK